MKAALSKSHYRQWLSDELLERKARNPGYSLRAFARDLGVNKTSLSDTLSGKHHLSRKASLRLAQELGWSPTQVQILLGEIDHRNSTYGNTPTRDSVDQGEMLQLRDDQFKLISDWYYIGILTTARLRTCKADPAWIARRLGISDFEAKNALATLERLGLVKTERGRLMRTTLPVRTPSGIPSDSIRKYHRQNLQNAERCLNQTPISKRIFGALSMTVDPDKLPEAEKLINEFKHKMNDLMEGYSAKEAYTLAIQFFPISKDERN